MEAPQAPAEQPCAAAAADAGQEQALQQAAQHAQGVSAPEGGIAEQQAREAAPAPAAAVADPQGQPPAAGPAAAADDIPDVDENAADGEAAAAGEGEEYDEELGAWLAGRLQRMQPGAELTVGSVKVLGKLLDEITVRVLEEAQRVSSGDMATSSSCPAADAGTAAAAVVPAPAAGQAAEAVAQAAPVGGERRGKQAQAKTSALTSLDIHKALKRVLPGEPSDNKLRPYLPAVTKQAWHLDKQSLKGIKRQKQAAGAAGPAAGLAAAAAEPAAGGPAPDQQQVEQPAGAASGAAKENQPLV